MADKKKIVAIGLLTAHDLEQLGAGFARAYPVDSAPCFGELLLQIDLRIGMRGRPGTASI